MNINPVNIIEDDDDFDLSQYLSKDQVQPRVQQDQITEQPGGAIPQQEQFGVPVEDDFDVSKYLSKQKPTGEIDSILGYPIKDIARQAAQYTARGLEGVAGIPGNIYQAVKQASEYLPDVPSIGPKQDTFVQEYAKKIGEKLPTTSDIRDFSRELTGEFLEPKTNFEKFAGEIAESTASLYAGGFNFLRSLGTSFLGNATKPVVESFGGGESAQEKAKAGVMLFSSLLNPGGAKEYAKNLFSNSLKSIPENTQITTKSLNKSLNEFFKDIQKGGMTPQKNHALELARQLRRTSSPRTMEFKEIPLYRQSLNDLRYNRDLNSVAHHWLDRFDRILNKEINQYGKTQNPAFLKDYRDANQIYSSLDEGNKISRFFARSLGAKQKLSPETLALLGVHTGPAGVAAAAGASGVSSGYNLINRMATNPGFRRYYRKTLNNAMRSNAPEMIKNVKKLDKEVRKEAEEN